MNPIIEYHSKIKSGEILTSKKIIKVFDKLVKTIQTSTKYIYSEEKADYAIAFIEDYCTHSKGKFAGQPLKLELWQKAIVGAVFGIINKATRLRKHREVFIIVARKNGKSVFMSAINLYMLIADGEQGAEIYSIATQKDQAKIVFNESYNMVTRNEELSQQIRKRQSDLYYAENMSFYKALASKSDSLDGKNPHAVTIDECHAIKDPNLYDVMSSSLGSRDQPILWIISTAGFVRENLYDTQYEYAEKWLNELIEDDDFLPFIWELDSKDEWTNPEMWIKANPNLGISKSVEYMMTQFNRAKNKPTEKGSFLTKHCNIRESALVRWLSYTDIKANNKVISWDQIAGSYVVGGADLSNVNDLTNATIFGELKTGEKFIMQMYFIARKQAERKIREDRVPYDVWEKAGWLTYTDGFKVDYSAVTKWFTDMRKQYNLKFLGVGYDPWNAQYWTDEMTNAGFDMEEVRQGTKTFSTPMKELEADFLDMKCIYNENPMLRWCLINTGIKRDENDNIRPIKENPKQRIDGTVGLLDAYVVFSRHYEDVKYALVLQKRIKDRQKRGE